MLCYLLHLQEDSFESASTKEVSVAKLSHLKVHYVLYLFFSLLLTICQVTATNNTMANKLTWIVCEINVIIIKQMSILGWPVFLPVQHFVHCCLASTWLLCDWLCIIPTLVFKFWPILCRCLKSHNFLTIISNARLESITLLNFLNNSFWKFFSNPSIILTKNSSFY